MVGKEGYFLASSTECLWGSEENGKLGCLCGKAGGNSHVCDASAHMVYGYGCLLSTRF